MAAAVLPEACASADGFRVQVPAGARNVGLAGFAVATLLFSQPNFELNLTYPNHDHVP